mgnify:CR=1 FL=1
MPRPILHLNQTIKIQEQNKTTAASLLSATKTRETKRTTEKDQLRLYRLLRQTRSPKYLQSIRQLDAGGPTCNRQQVEELQQVLTNEFPEVEIKAILLGVVAICYLGCPYEVHTLDLMGGIIEHFKENQPLPSNLEKARALALSGSYAFVEVYVDCCRAISEDGSVSVING